VNVREQLIAYLATLAALVLTLLGAMLIAAFVPAVMDKISDFALGTVFGGLIGVLTRPAARSPTATTDSGDVTVQAESKQ